MARPRPDFEKLKKVYQAYQRAVKNGQKISFVANKLGISRSSIYRRLHWYTED